MRIAVFHKDRISPYTNYTAYVHTNEMFDFAAIALDALHNNYHNDRQAYEKMAELVEKYKTRYPKVEQDDNSI